MDGNKTGQYLLKEFQDIEPEKWPELPVSAIKGVSKGDEKLLKESFNVTSIKGLAQLKFFHWAEEINSAAESGLKELTKFENKLIKKYEKKTPKSLLRSPIYALQGISEKDSERLEKAFNIKTIRAFSRLKYYQYAKEILSEAETFIVQSPGNLSGTENNKIESEPPSANAWINIFGIIIIVSLFLIGYYIWNTNINTSSKNLSQNKNEEKINLKSAKQMKKNQNNKSQEKPSVLQVQNKNLNQKFYTIQHGDTLAKISYKLYENYSKTKFLYEMNKDILQNMNQIFPGQKIRVQK